ncbi:ankyrin repeat domain-containing protein [Endozoicomonas sp. ALD040]|uniref:ankyrin repeat domain-containing protein n=1 Tax=Endozoicomonas sp. ALD040 TaxID=3403079 RepID=UPI003BAFA1D7
MTNKSGFSDQFAAAAVGQSILGRPPRSLTPWTLKADPCPICLAPFHDRNVEPVVVRTQCCGHRFDLDCISRCFVDQPIGSRRCLMCRQNPMPVVNQNTSESHPDTFFPDQTFYLACLNGDLDQVERSLAEGVNVNAVMTNGLTALMLASGWGHTDVVERLINAGVNLNAALSDGTTTLFIAAQMGHTYCVKLLIEAEANLNVRASDGATPLAIAIKMGNTDSMKLLINAEAKLGTEAVKETKEKLHAVQ